MIFHKGPLQECQGLALVGNRLPSVRANVVHYYHIAMSVVYPVQYRSRARVIDTNLGLTVHTAAVDYRD